MISVLGSSAVDRKSGQTKDYKLMVSILGSSAVDRKSGQTRL
jgi:hypothetical protein